MLTMNVRQHLAQCGYLARPVVTGRPVAATPRTLRRPRPFYFYVTAFAGCVRPATTAGRARNASSARRTCG